MLGTATQPEELEVGLESGHKKSCLKGSFSEKIGEQIT